MARKVQKCSQCGKDRRTCDCVMEKAYAVENYKGQRNMLNRRRYDEEMLEDLNFMADWFGIEREGLPVTTEMIQAWVGARCKSRKTRQDFGGLNALRRDFMDWAKDVPATPSIDSFETALIRSGYQVEKGFVASLVLRIDLA